jgi:hypothetical protein
MPKVEAYAAQAMRAVLASRRIRRRGCAANAAPPLPGGPGEVLISVRCAGVGFAEVLMRRSGYANADSPRRSSSPAGGQGRPRALTWDRPVRVLGRGTNSSRALRSSNGVESAGDLGAGPGRRGISQAPQRVMRPAQVHTGRLPCGNRLAAVAVAAASSTMTACSRLIGRPFTSQRSSGWCSATAMHGRACRGSRPQTGSSAARW